MRTAEGSAQVLKLPSSPILLCDMCVGSPPNEATQNLGFELTGTHRFAKRAAKFEIHICADCLSRFFLPFVPGLRRLDAEVKFEAIRGFFVVLPLKRLQRKRR